MTKLNAMENPYPWPDYLVDAWLDELRKVALGRYPDPQSTALKQRVREVLGIPEKAALLLGNGSDELIQLIALTLAGEGRVLLAPEPTFVVYRTAAASARMRYVPVLLRGEGFGLNMQEMLAAIERYQPAVVFLSYPNNPTGNLFESEQIHEILSRAPGLVVLDEAYAPFAGKSFLDRLDSFPNLLVMRTLSKLGLAGLRLGLLAGAHDWLNEMEKLRLPYNIGVLNQVSAEFALRYFDVLEAQTRQIKLDRGRLYAELCAIEQVTPFPSHANFITFRVRPGQAARVFQCLCDQRVLIKNLDASAPLLEDCLRVTVGTPDENRCFLRALRLALQADSVRPESD